MLSPKRPAAGGESRLRDSFLYLLAAEKTREDLMRDSIGRNFIKYVSLNIFGTIGLTCYILADTFFIARGMGADGIAALNLALPMFNLIFGVGIMLGTGGATRYAILRAQERPDEADGVYSLALWTGAAAGILFMAAGVGCVGPLTKLLGADEQIYGLTRVYLNTIFWFAPFFILNQIVGAFVRNDGAPRLAMAAMMAGSLANILFDYIFIFPMGMGMFGAALATGVSPVISLAVLGIYFIKKKNGMHLIRKGVPVRSLPEIGALGFSAFLNEISGGFVIMAFNYVFLRLSGNLGVAAYGVVANLAIVVVCLFNGLAQGVQPLVSTCYGKQDRVGMRRLLRLGLVTSLIFAVLVYAGSWFGTEALVNLFNSERNPELSRLAGEGLRIYFAGFFFSGFNILLAFYFSASERPLPAFVISAIRGFAVIIPAILILSEIGGMTGAWLAYPIAEGIALAAAAALGLRKPAGQKK
jgi:putative MATE family efflux protein